jgi:hypothetical protein
MNVAEEDTKIYSKSLNNFFWGGLGVGWQVEVDMKEN